MANDMVRLAIDRAVVDFGNEGDGLFNAAGFGVALHKLAGVTGSMDGLVVRAVLTGRRDVEVLPGSYYRRVSSADSARCGETS